ncbi:hypothetical protein LR021_00175, partial [Candidatus Bipolaricaulota bacterium]|nr:hypothetical protein [Candidatus Bipolaricaulota bacterium]
ADYTEVRIEGEQRSQVLFRKDKLENLESSSEFGGIVRCLKDGGWGIAVFNDPAQLPAKITEATRIARLVAARASEPVQLAPVPAVTEEVRVDLERDFRTVPLLKREEGSRCGIQRYSPQLR